MVRIIDPKPDPKVEKKVSCEECGVRLGYVPMEVKSVVSHDYGGGSDTYYYIDCPNCGNKTSVKGY